MPLFHSTSFQNFRDIVLSHTLSPTPCSVFVGEDLLYLFYGRPAYRVSQEVAGGGLLNHLPVGFVLQPGSVSTAKRVYPFDSGAFMGGLYKSFLGNFPLDRFEMGDFPEAVQKLVTAFYGNNRNYYFGTSGPAAIAPRFVEAASYFAMLRDTAMTFGGPHKSADDRRLTVEIQSEAGIDLRAEEIANAGGAIVVQHKVLAVVLPQGAMDDEVINEAVTKIWKAAPLTYREYYPRIPSEYHGVIRDKVADLLEPEGIL